MRNEPNDRRQGERGSTLVLVLLFMTLFFGLGVALLASANIESTITHNDEWFEGSLYAAEAGLQTGIDQVGQNISTSVTAIPDTNMGDTYTYRSGDRSSGSAQPINYLGSASAAGYALNLGTGYNPEGYVFLSYQVNSTGSGPRNIVREVEAQVDYGPVPN